MRYLMIALCVLMVSFSVPVFAGCNSECRPNGQCAFSAIPEFGCIQYPGVCLDDWCGFGFTSDNGQGDWTAEQQAKIFELAKAGDREALLKMVAEHGRPIVVRTAEGFEFDSFAELGVERPTKPAGWVCPSATK